MKKVPEVKDGFILIPIEDGRKIGEYLRILNEAQRVFLTTDRGEYDRVQFDAYCFEQAKEKK